MKVYDLFVNVPEEIIKEGNKMKQDTIKKIEETIHRDGSLSEERKTRLLNLLTTIKPEVTEKYIPISNRMRKEDSPARYRNRIKM
jgi:hypothetical protein